MKALCVVGARPNFMKIKPVLDALEGRGAETVLVHTGQHYDSALSGVFFKELGIRHPDFHLEAGSGSHARQTAAVMTSFEDLLEDIATDVVVTVGDVNSTLACSLVAAKKGTLLAHVEAGLRSRDWTMPEEINRVVADRLSDFLFAPSADAVVNLQREGYRSDQIHLVGNVMIDTLRANIARAQKSEILARLDLEPGKYGLVTLHRPDNVDSEADLFRLMKGLKTISTDLPLVFPVHPRTELLLGKMPPTTGIKLTEPLGYLDFISLEASARLVLTDSGGIQEETTYLGVPCLTLRDNTERPITITEGTNQLAGRDPEQIFRAATEILKFGVEARRPALWDGHAGERIADVLLAEVPRSPRPRPTSLADER
jgi:UDP-N-acetylglucosamine 2-epimerase (non-hydrolysing)